jgi:hypothetical protein
MRWTTILLPLLVIACDDVVSPQLLCDGEQRNALAEFGTPFEEIRIVRRQPDRSVHVSDRWDYGGDHVIVFVWGADIDGCVVNTKVTDESD